MSLLHCSESLMILEILDGLILVDFWRWSWSVDEGFNLGSKLRKSCLFCYILISGIVYFVFLDWCSISIHWGIWIKTQHLVSKLNQEQRKKNVNYKVQYCEVQWWKWRQVMEDEDGGHLECVKKKKNTTFIERKIIVSMYESVWINGPSLNPNNNANI